VCEISKLILTSAIVIPPLTLIGIVATELATSPIILSEKSVAINSRPQSKISV